MTKRKKNQLKLSLFKSICGVTYLMFLGGITQVRAFTTDIKTEEKLQQLKTNEDVKITGKIVSAGDNLGIPGVNVMLKGTKIVTTTDFDGNYSINVPTNNAVLIITYVGYITQEVKVGKSTTLNISLKEDVASLDEVIVVGYGQKKKESLSGAIEQIKSDVFQDRAVTNVALALQGQTPGLTISRTSPRPGNEGVSLQIRGITSVNGGSPLIVIDGAPAFDTSEFYQMNPDDIENISVLKDGAASIYGSRAANGVILVTTKKGKGKLKVEFNSNFRYNSLGLKPPVTTYQQWGQMWVDAAKQDGNGDYWNLGETAMKAIANGESGYYQTNVAAWGKNGLLYIAPADRYDELYGNNIGNQQSLSFSGSSDSAKYRLSLGTADTQGALKTSYDGMKQYTARLNTDFDVTSKFKIGANVSLLKNISSSPSSQLGGSLAAQDPPIFPSKNPNGQWYSNFGSGGGGTNSIAGTTDGGRDNTDENITKLSLTASYDIGYGFSANANATYNAVSSRQDITLLNVKVYDWDGTPALQGINTTSSIQTETKNKSYQTYGAFLNYKHTLGKHNIELMAGLTAEKNDFASHLGKRTDIIDEGVYDLSIATGIQTNSGKQEQEGLYSYLSRINYDYDQKYLFEVVGRHDGSSRFAPGYKFKNYGSVSVGWNIHKENFLKNFKPLTNLKMRASIGTSGNQVGIELYDYVSTIGQGTTVFGDTPTLSSTSFINGITTTDRTWESVEMKNIGVDFAFFNNKLSGTFDTYVKNNNGMLISITYPDALGGTAPKTNSGNLRTTGWEAMLNWKDKIGKLGYNIGVNMGDSNNKLLKLEGAGSLQEGLNKTIEGFPLNSYFAWQTDGLFQTQAEIDSYYAAYTKNGNGDLPVQTGVSGLRIGDTKKVDLDGNGQINDISTDGGDVKYVGDAQLHYVFGINLGLQYAGFDFSTMFQGSLEQVVFRGGYIDYPFSRRFSNQTNAYIGQTWTAENTDAIYPRLTSNTARAGWNWKNNDIIQQNNQYIRLKTIIIGYSLPSSVIKKMRLDKLRFYFSGNDLFEWSAIKDGYDPESGTLPTEEADTNRAIYPFQRTVSLGVNIGF